jgi:Mn-containing catalase
MTDDPGVKATLQFNLARDTFHQQQWLLGIEQLIEDGFTDGLEDSLKEEEHHEAARTFYSFDLESQAGEGRWAQGNTLVGDQEIKFEAGRPLADDINQVPAPDPLLFATYDGSMGPGTPGNAAGAYKQGAENLVSKAKEVLTGE